MTITYTPNPDGGLTLDETIGFQFDGSVDNTVPGPSPTTDDDDTDFDIDGGPPKK